MVMKDESLVTDSGKPDYDDQTLDEEQIDYHDPDQLDQHQQLPSSLILSSSTSGDPNGAIVINGKQMDLSSERYAVLSYEQVTRLDNVMDEVVPIHGRGNFPTLEMKLKDLVSVVRGKLEEESVTLRDIRLNGGAASYILCPNNLTYNDLDLIFVVDLSTSRNFDKVRSAVLDSLLDFLPEGVNKKRISSCSLKEAYVHKMVKVNEGGDRWSLISLSNNRGRNVELKFVDSMRRQFEFSVDSFQIILDSLLSFYEVDPPMRMSENFYPTVVGESVYGDFREALFHLNKRLIATRNPEEIRGGGLLKYCNLLVRKYRQLDEIKNLERYMCSRFFIDFSDLCQQRKKLESYIANHFVGDDQMKYEYLMKLFNVVDESTVCLMGHERRQTLHLIQELAYHYYYQDQQKLMLKQQFDAAAAAAAAAVAAAAASSTSSSSSSSPSSSPLSTSTYTFLSSSSSATSVSNSCSSTAVSLSPCSSPSSTCSISSSSSTSSLSSCTSSAAVAAHAAAAAAAHSHQSHNHYYYGNSAQIYYSPYHSYNCNHQPNCFNPCHCGGWMTCA